MLIENVDTSIVEHGVTPDAQTMALDKAFWSHFCTNLAPATWVLGAVHALRQKLMGVVRMGLFDDMMPIVLGTGRTHKFLEIVRILKVTASFGFRQRSADAARWRDCSRCAGMFEARSGQMGRYELARFDRRVRSDLGNFAFRNRPGREVGTALHASQRRAMGVGERFSIVQDESLNRGVTVKAHSLDG